MAPELKPHRHFLVGRGVTLTRLASQLSSGRVINENVRHNIPEGKENKYLHRFIIYIALFLQSLLNCLSKLMSKFNLKLEKWLNHNQDENSAGYFSILGHLDKRIDLDKEIKHGDGRYYPALTMMASKLAYENENVIKSVVSNHWKMEFKKFYNCCKVLGSTKSQKSAPRATQAFMFSEKTPENETFIVAFRGTSPMDTDDWCTDLDLSWCEFKGMGKTHFGFMAALGLNTCSYNTHENDFSGYWPKEVDQQNPNDPPLAYYTIREDLRKIIKDNKTARFVFTGHSLGGALAILFPAILALHGEEEILDRLEGVYTYGQPRVGDEKFGRFMKRVLREHGIKYYRIVYGCDVVPSLPWDNTYKTFKFLVFKHFGRGVHFNSLYHAKIVEEEEKPEKKTEENVSLRILRDISVFQMNFILKRLNAMWELIRAFIIPYTAGPDFKEGWLQIVFRLTVGLKLPEVVAHGPQDYVNATRLGPEEVFQHYTSYMRD